MNKLNVFALVTGYNVELLGRNNESLLQNVNLFTCHKLDTRDVMVNNAYSFVGHATGISWNDFDIVDKHKIINWNYHSIEYVALLDSLEMKQKLIPFVMDDMD